MSKTLPQYRVSQSVKSRILNSLPDKLSESPQLAKNQYVIKMMEQKEILCSHCYKILEIGSSYNRNQKTNRRMIYYFCMDCDKKRYY